jgi:hypothetical protein
MPEWLKCRVSIPGSSISVIVTQVQGDGIYDVGILDINDDAPRFRLEPGHGLDATVMSQQGLALLLSDPPVRLSIDRASLDRDGELHVFPTMATACDMPCLAAIDLRTQEPGNVPWPSSLPSEIIVEQELQDGRCFELSTEGTYKAVQTRPVKIDLRIDALPLGAERITCGWSWRTIPVELFSGRSPLPPVREVYSLSLPFDGVQTWWSDNRAGPLATSSNYTVVRRIGNADNVIVEVP